MNSSSFFIRSSSSLWEFTPEHAGLRPEPVTASASCRKLRNLTTKYMFSHLNSWGYSDMHELKAVLLCECVGAPAGGGNTLCHFRWVKQPKFLMQDSQFSDVTKKQKQQEENRRKPSKRMLQVISPVVTVTPAALQLDIQGKICPCRTNLSLTIYIHLHSAFRRKCSEAEQRVTVWCFLGKYTHTFHNDEGKYFGKHLFASSKESHRHINVSLVCVNVTWGHRQQPAVSVQSEKYTCQHLEICTYWCLTSRLFNPYRIICETQSQTEVLANICKIQLCKKTAFVSRLFFCCAVFAFDQQSVYLQRWSWINWSMLQSHTHFFRRGSECMFVRSVSVTLTGRLSMHSNQQLQQHYPRLHGEHLHLLLHSCSSSKAHSPAARPEEHPATFMQKNETILHITPAAVVRNVYEKLSGSLCCCSFLQHLNVQQLLLQQAAIWQHNYCVWMWTWSGDNEALCAEGPHMWLCAMKHLFLKRTVHLFE